MQVINERSVNIQPTGTVQSGFVVKSFCGWAGDQRAERERFFSVFFAILFNCEGF